MAEKLMRFLSANKGSLAGAGALGLGAGALGGAAMGSMKNKKNEEESEKHAAYYYGMRKRASAYGLSRAQALALVKAADAIDPSMLDDLQNMGLEGVEEQVAQRLPDQMPPADFGSQLLNFSENKGNQYSLGDTSLGSRGDYKAILDKAQNAVNGFGEGARVTLDNAANGGGDAYPGAHGTFTDNVRLNPSTTTEKLMRFLSANKGSLAGAGALGLAAGGAAGYGGTRKKQQN
jgi:hypothetical protein